ncbi:hypothetical protein ACLOJK_024460 [Asimina triloba]
MYLRDTCERTGAAIWHRSSPESPARGRKALASWRTEDRNEENTASIRFQEENRKAERGGGGRRRTYEESKGEVGDDRESDGDGREFEVADVADEDLRGGIGAVEAEDVEGDGSGDAPQLAGLGGENGPGVGAGLDGRVVFVGEAVGDRPLHGQRRRSLAGVRRLGARGCEGRRKSREKKGGEGNLFLEKCDWVWTLDFGAGRRGGGNAAK